MDGPEAGGVAYKHLHQDNAPSRLLHLGGWQVTAGDLDRDWGTHS
jgi:hypothetical protein